MLKHFALAALAALPLAANATEPALEQQIAERVAAPLSKLEQDIRTYARDPSSVEIITRFYCKDLENNMDQPVGFDIVAIEFRARNGFGGMAFPSLVVRLDNQSLEGDQALVKLKSRCKKGLAAVSSN